MCYFHVVLNCKKNKLDIPNDLLKPMFKKCIHRLHMTTSSDHFIKYYKQFVSALYNDCPEFIRYFFNSWASSKTIIVYLKISINLNFYLRKISLDSMEGLLFSPWICLY